MSEITTANVSIAWEDYMDFLGRPRAQSRAEFDRWLAGVKAEAWDEAMQALVWALDNGAVDFDAALQYVVANNVHRALSASAGDAS